MISANRRVISCGCRKRRLDPPLWSCTVTPVLEFFGMFVPATDSCELPDIPVFVKLHLTVMYHTHKSDKWISEKLYSEPSEYYDRRETSASVQISLKHIYRRQRRRLWRNRQITLSEYQIDVLLKELSVTSSFLCNVTNQDELEDTLPYYSESGRVDEDWAYWLKGLELVSSH